MSNMRQTIRAVAFEEDGWWVAQCLEYDIAAQAKTLPALVREVWRVLYAYSIIGKKEGIDVWAHKSKAPAVFWKLFNQHGKKVPFDKDPYAADNAPRPRLTEVRIVVRKQVTP